MKKCEQINEAIPTAEFLDFWASVKHLSAKEVREKVDERLREHKQKKADSQ